MSNGFLFIDIDYQDGLHQINYKKFYKNQTWILEKR